MAHSHRTKKQHEDPTSFKPHNTTTQAQRTAWRCKDRSTRGKTIQNTKDPALRLEIQREVERAIG